MRCPTGELNGFPRRKSIAAATAATSSQNQVTATAGAADPSRDPLADLRSGGSGVTRPRPLGHAPGRLRLSLRWNFEAFTSGYWVSLARESLGSGYTGSSSGSYRVLPFSPADLALSDSLLHSVGLGLSF